MKPIPSHELKKLAYDLGFAFCGVGKADFMEPEARQLEAWLNAGYHAEMDYMARNFDLRTDPRKLVPGAQSVIVLGYNYFPEKDDLSRQRPKIARYAYGEDYHFVVKRHGKELLRRLQEKYGAIEGRVFVDSAPVLERQWAQRTGQGWLGKNTLLLRRDSGSWFFLCELIVDLAFEPDGPVADFCGTCRRCIDACPTDAIADQGYVLDASKCISYLSIELKGELNAALSKAGLEKDQMEGWAFGCDICQEVCPWNRFAQAHKEEAFQPVAELASMDEKDWEQLSEESFNRLFKRSPLKRKGYSGFKSTLQLLSSDKEGITED